MINEQLKCKNRVNRRTDVCDSCRSSSLSSQPVVRPDRESANELIQAIQSESLKPAKSRRFDSLPNRHSIIAHTKQQKFLTENTRIWGLKG